MAAPAKAPTLQLDAKEFASMAETLKLFDQFEAAAMLGVSQSTLRRMRSMGDGPAFVRVATRRIGYSREALADWVQVRTVAPPAARDLIAA